MKTNTNTTGTQDNDFNLFPAQVLTNTNTELRDAIKQSIWKNSAYTVALVDKDLDGVMSIIDQYVHQKTIEARIAELDTEEEKR